MDIPLFILHKRFFLSKKTTSNDVVFFGGFTRNRTKDTRIFSPLLYRLSYEAMEKSGDDLLSRRASPEVSSARRGLTVVFGMGTGVTLDVIDTRS